MRKLCNDRESFCLIERRKYPVEIKTYFGEYDDEIISLILDIQNKESKINLSLQEQPDLLDIRHSYQDKGGQF